MKKVFCLIVFSVVVLNSFGQISYEATYPPSNTSYPVIKYFNHTSPKWLTVYGSTITLYNLDHSIYRQFPFFGTGGTVMYVSDDLFDSDSLNFEYIIHEVSGMKVYREDGTILFSRDSSMFGGVSLYSDFDFVQSIMPTDSGTKMRLYITNSTSSRYEIYSLPGKLPCPMTCGGVRADELAHVGIQHHQDQKSPLPYPNPSSNEIYIPIELKAGETGEIIFYGMTGAEVKRYKVDATFKDLVLSTADLSAGSYYYQLLTAHSKSEGRKLIVIK